MGTCSLGKTSKKVIFSASSHREKSVRSLKIPSFLTHDMIVYLFYNTSKKKKKREKRLYLVEARATEAQVSTILADKSKSCWLPVTSYDLKHVKAVPSRPVFTVGSIPDPAQLPPPSFHVTSTTCTTTPEKIKAQFKLFPDKTTLGNLLSISEICIFYKMIDNCSWFKRLKKKTK